MKHLLLIVLIVSLVSCGNDAGIDHQISLYKDSISVLAKQQSAIVDSPMPDSDTALIRRKTELQKIEIKRMYFKEKIAELEKKK